MQPGELRARRQAIGMSPYVIAMGMGISRHEIVALEEGRASAQELDRYAQCLARLEQFAPDRLAAELFIARQGRRFTA